MSDSLHRGCPRPFRHRPFAPVLATLAAAAWFLSTPLPADEATLEATLGKVFIDDFQRGRSETRYFLVDSAGKSRPLVLPEGTEPATRTGSPDERGASSLGEQRTVLLLVNSYENPVEEATVAEMRQRLLGDSNPYSIDAYFREVSYGKAWLSGEVYGWYTLPLTEQQLCDDYEAVLAAAIEAADPDVWFPDYFRLMILFSDAGCAWGGLGNNWMANFSTDDGEVQMSWSLYNSVAQFGGAEEYGGSAYHELGHNFGVSHANDWECGEEVLGGGCESINYGDDFDAMGRAGAKGHYNAFHKEACLWFDPGQVVIATAPGVYALEPLETAGPGVKALKIPTASGFSFSVEFRRPIGFDAHLLDFYPADHDGAMLHINRNSGNGDTQLLDTTPHENSGGGQTIDSLFAVLGPGRRFADAETGVSITTLAVSEERLVVAIGLRPYIAAGPGPAYENPPLVRLFPPEQDAAAVVEFTAYGTPHFGANVGAGDVDGDGAAEILTGPGPGAVFGPHIRGFGADGTPLAGLSFLAYGTHKYGVHVAAGDIDGDGYAEIVTGAGPGAVFGPHVRGFDYDGTGSVTPAPGVSFLAYGTHKWGVHVAAGDIDCDGYAEIVTGAGPGAVFGPHVRGWNVDGGATAAIPGVSFLAYGTSRYGVRVCCGDVDGDGMAEVVTAPGPSAAFGAQVRGWNYDGTALSELPGCDFFAWPPSAARYGATVSAAADLDGDGSAELVVGAGPDPSIGSPVKVYRYDGQQVSQWLSLEAFPADWRRGVNVASGVYYPPD